MKPEAKSRILSEIIDPMFIYAQIQAENLVHRDIEVKAWFDVRNGVGLQLILAIERETSHAIKNHCKNLG